MTIKSASSPTPRSVSATMDLQWAIRIWCHFALLIVLRCSTVESGIECKTPWRSTLSGVRMWLESHYLSEDVDETACGYLSPAKWLNSTICELPLVDFSYKVRDLFRLVPYTILDVRKHPKRLRTKQLRAYLSTNFTRLATPSSFITLFSINCSVHPIKRPAAQFRKITQRPNYIFLQSS